VTERVDEINRATGVIFPFGVRASWRVRDDQGRVVEKKIHQVLKELRVRTDREFFCMDFRDAVKIINSVIKDYHGDV
jgi:Arc/MetJ family transcription regulator